MQATGVLARVGNSIQRSFSGKYPALRPSAAVLYGALLAMCTPGCSADTPGGAPSVQGGSVPPAVDTGMDGAQA